MPFRWAAILPVVLLVVFGLIWLRDRARGGYQVVRLESQGERSMPKLAAFPKGFFDALVQRRMTVFQWIEMAGRLELEGAELGPKFLDSFELVVSRAGPEGSLDAGAGASDVLLLSRLHPARSGGPEARAGERPRHAPRHRRSWAGSTAACLSGQNRPGLVEAEAMKWVIDCLWQLEPHAKAAGILMCMENHYKDNLWTYPEFAQSHRRYLAILDAVIRPGSRRSTTLERDRRGRGRLRALDRVLPRVATMQASDRYLEGGTIQDLRRMAADPQHGYAKIIQARRDRERPQRLRPHLRHARRGPATTAG
jgi:hypothetical protein